MNQEGSEFEALMKESGLMDEGGNVIEEPSEQEQEKKAQAFDQRIQNAQKIREKVFVEPKAEPSTTDKVVGAVKDEASKISATDLGKQAVGGVLDMVDSVSQLVYEAADFADNKLNLNKIPNDQDINYFGEMIPPSPSMTGKAVRAISQFAVPFTAAAKMLKVGTSVGRGLAAGAAADFLAFKGKGPRLSNFVQEYPELANPVAAYLAADADDTEMEGRFKNVMEGAMLGGMVDAGIFAYKGIRGIKAANNLDKTLNMTADEVAKAKPAKTIKAEEPKVETGTEQVTPAEVPKDAPITDEVTSDVVNEQPDIVVGGEINKMIPESAPTFREAARAGNRDVVVSDIVDLSKPIDEITESGGAYLNLDRLTDDESVKVAIKNFSDSNTEVLQNAAIGNTFEETKKLADLTGLTEKDIVNLKVGEGFNAQQLYASRVFLVSSANRLKKLAKEAYDDNGTESLIRFSQAMNSHRALQYAVTNMKAEAGRILNSLKIKVGSDIPDLDLMMKNDMLDMLGRENLHKMAGQMATMPPDKVGKVIKKATSQKIFDAAEEVYKNNLLFKVSTHAVNFVSNTLTLAEDIAERTIAPFMKNNKKIPSKEEVTKAFEKRKSLMSVDRSKLTFDEDLQLQNQLVKVNKKINEAYTTGVIKGESATFARTATKATAENIVDGVQGFFQAIRVLYKQKNLKKFGALTSKFNDGAGGAAITSDYFAGGYVTDLVGAAQRTPYAMLQLSDDFFKDITYQASLASLNRRLGVSMGKTGKELAEFIKTNPADEYMKYYAQKDAAYNTFQNALNKPAQELANFIRNAGTDELSVAPLRFIIPFVKTPINIARYQWERNPFSMMGKAYNEEIKAGGARQQMAEAKIAFGASLFTAVGMSAMNETITGGGPSDFRERQKLEATGWRRYAVKVGDKYISFEKLGPIAYPVKMAADLADAIRHTDLDDGVTLERITELGNALTWMTVETFAPEMLVQSFGNLFDAIEEGDGKKLVANVAPNLVPFAGVTRQFNKDEYIKMYNDPTSAWPFLEQELEKIKEGIPGLGSKAEPRLNIWGDPIPSSKVTLGPEFISLFDMGEIKANDTVTEEMIRLGYFGRVKKQAPDGEDYLNVSMPGRSFSIYGESVDLDNKEYNEYVRYSAGIGLRDDIPTLKESLKEQIDNDYPLLNEENKTDEAKRFVIKKIISQYREAAKKKLVSENENVETKYRKASDLKKKAITRDEEEEITNELE